MGFKATEAVEELSYDFKPHVNAEGTIPEPSTKQIEKFRTAVFDAFKSTGLNPEDLANGTIKFDQLDDLLNKTDEMQTAMFEAVAEVTTIPLNTLNALPYRVAAAFMGWIVGELISPEA